jgi:periplasmic protein TonB
MFGDTLLESSPASRKRKRWPMATAFTAQTIIAAIIVVVPLLSTGVIPLSARVPVYKPETHIRIERVEPVAERSPSSGPANPAPAHAAVLLTNNNPNAIHIATNAATTEDPDLATPGTHGPSTMPSGLVTEGSETATVRPDSGPKRKIVVSVLEEARLVNKVEPVYPRIAVISGVQGEVKLHAIIARNGTIQSLNAVSGHPLLVRAAMDAVGQWRYRPYILNGEAVEVETFITVNFRKDGR